MHARIVSEKQTRLPNPKIKGDGDGVGIWLVARRLNQERFDWPGVRRGSQVELDTEQLQDLVQGLPTLRVSEIGQ
ncbi:IS66 family insertion sequence element accessory protein TnpB [Pseudomonas sp. LjRoot277]|uniref:IS66 family insertion sequence element accessory protein TnpB n=1 Tax=Pseudomonas sp. LjRoot277 TaxID=3342307 RepID=UPI003F5049F4